MQTRINFGLDILSWLLGFVVLVVCALHPQLVWPLALDALAVAEIAGGFAGFILAAFTLLQALEATPQVSPLLGSLSWSNLTRGLLSTATWWAVCCVAALLTWGCVELAPGIGAIAWASALATMARSSVSTLRVLWLVRKVVLRHK